MAPTTAELDRRVTALEDKVDEGPTKDPVLQLMLAALERQDGQTAAAVDTLTKTINDPEDGLIVGLRLFRAEVAADRIAFRSWVRGATVTLGVIITVANVAAPWIQRFLEVALHIAQPGS